MSDIVSAVLKFTFGFLANTTRRGIAKRLRESDVTDEECRRLIVRELDDIKRKLDGLARKDLLSSLSFLQEGINGFYQSPFQLDSNENKAKSTTQATLSKATSSTDTGSDSVIDKAVALANAMTSLEIHSNDRFKSAIESFKLAREKATEAFCNEALSIEDRIQATQIITMARILEKSKDPDASVSDCLQYLKQLHDIGAIQEIFSVLVDGGIKSPFYKTRRLDIASSVQLMNQRLFEFARNFTKLPPRYLDWPMILFGNKSYHAVFGEFGLGKLKMSGTQVVSLIPDFTFDDKISPRLCVVNSKGDILALTQKRPSLKIFKRSGESRTLCEVPREEHALEWNGTAMEIDAEDKIYVLTKFRKSQGELWCFKLFIFDENGNKKFESSLSFLSCFPDRKCMALSKDGKIAILHCVEKTLYIGKASLEQNLFEVEKLRFPIQLEMENLLYIKIMFADFNSTKIVARDWLNIYIYTDDGKLERKINGTLEPELIQSFTMNQDMKRIVVKVKNLATSYYNLLSFSETEELMYNSNLGSSEWIQHAELISHPNGPVALVGETGATLLQQ